MILRPVLAVTLLGASLAFAQSTPTEAPGNGFSEVERGVFLGVFGVLTGSA